jgi:hypothetical protein
MDEKALAIQDWHREDLQSGGPTPKNCSGGIAGH